MKIYYLHICYDAKADDFFAIVDDNVVRGKSIFQIDTTEEMCDYIRTGRMKHIDDVDGLEIFMKEQQFIEKEDKILLDEEVMT